MSIPQYCLSWDSYKNNICSGFTKLQQNDEFVDMTLAADGHLVNVHKSIFALASPYIKTMLQSIPNKYPVIVLNNITHEVLTYILTYVYTGEVSIEVNKMQAFMKAATDLHISGLTRLKPPKVGPQGSNKNVGDPEYKTVTNNTTTNLIPESVINESMLMNTESIAEQTLTSNIQLNICQNDITQSIGKEPIVYNIVTKQHIMSSDKNIYDNEEPTTGQPMANEELLNNADNSRNGLYMTADGYPYQIQIKPVNENLPDYTNHGIEEVSYNFTCATQMPSIYTGTNIPSNSVGINNGVSDSVIIENITEKNETLSISLPVVNRNEIGATSSNITINSSINTTSTLDPKALTPQYTMSTRGSLQLILNRYMYYSHHQSDGGRKRRWRCIDYRKKHCPAFIDTDCDIMTIRKFVHSHSFHDEKIMKKMKKNMVFTTLNNAIQKLKNK